MNINFINTNFYRKILGFFQSVSFFDLIHFICSSYKKFFSKINNFKFNSNLNLINIFNIIFPIKINSIGVLIKFIKFKFLKPINSFTYCLENGLTYSGLLKAKFCVFQSDSSLKEVSKCQYLTLSNIPVITDNGTFVINGIEKVIVSKFVRAPGIYFSYILKCKKKVFLIKIISNNEITLDFFLNIENFLILKVLIYELPICFFLRYLGLSNKDIIDKFYNFQYVYFFNNFFKIKFIDDYFLNISFPYDIYDNNNNILVPKNILINENYINLLKSFNIEYLNIDEDYLLGKFLGSDIFINNNFLLAYAGEQVDKFLLFKIKCFRVSNIDIIYFSTDAHSSVVLSLVRNEFNFFDIKKLVDDFFLKIGFVFIKQNFSNFNKNFNKKKFDISHIRNKINLKLRRNSIFGPKYISCDDIIDIIRFLILFKDGLVTSDDMQSLNSMNLNLVGDMLYDIFYKFFFILKKNILLKKNFLKKKYVYFFPEDFLKFDSLNFEIKKFFNISKYSQFLDQTNILSELSHKRRVSFLGIPGISKKHSGFDVRDLNSSYYSKLCPVETPEGINIGLVSSLSLFTLVDRNKNLLAPYYKVLNSKILSNSILYLNFLQERNMVFSDASVNILSDFSIKKSIINARFNNELILTKSDLVNFIDILPYQILSVCAALVPFIEYNDSNRALMASNMLKQALPCLFPQRPIIGTGLEFLIGLNSNTLLFSRSTGIVKYIDSTVLVLEKKYRKKNIIFFDYDFYRLCKNRASNQNTHIGQRFIVGLKDEVFKGDIIADGSCTDMGELAIGQNMLVAFMSWDGYNFEDSLIVSEKVLIDDRYTSLEIFNLDFTIYSSSDFYDIITRDIDCDFSKLKNLDKFGIVRPGTTVSYNDLLVGKKTFYLKKNVKKPISSELDFFNTVVLKKNPDLIDSSFYLPSNFNLAVVQNVEVYFSKDIVLDSIDNELLNFKIIEFLEKKKKIFISFIKNIKLKLRNFFFDKEVIINNNVILLDFSFLKKKSIPYLLNLVLKNNELNFAFKKFSLKFKNFLKDYKFMCKNIRKKFVKVLPPNVSKMIKFFFIRKKKLQVGDKMSGRHGNKGVVSKIVPVNNMPYTSNGIPIDIILNPLGVPSRMNIGQLLEIHLGLVSFIIKLRISDFLLSKDFFSLKKFLFDIYSILNDKISLTIKNCSDEYIVKFSKFLNNGFYFGVPAFNSFKEDDINRLLNYVTKNYTDLGFSDTKKQIYLYDGITGKRFENPVTVGIMYILKLNHLAENKIHSRSVGPYSLISQQPLKGKTNYGGQRIGEMEVWALEAYGASYTLRDMLTIKSDDIYGRYDTYKSIIDGSFRFKFNKPESFNVMISNIISLGLYIRFIE